MDSTTMTASKSGLLEGLGDELRAGMRGEVILPGDETYDEARKVYNAMIDKRPRMIARCIDAGDVIQALACAHEHALEVAVRCGGHNGGGLGSVDDGLVIDLSSMRGVQVDPERRTATVLGGSLLGDVDHATHAFGLAAPFGIIGTTGVGGLTLGGGIGYLTRKLGLSIDNLIGADVVLADGSFVRADEDQHEDLFWALRGGGGNFGVVTSFTFRLSPISTIVGGPTLFALERTPEILRWYREFLPNAPEDLNGVFTFLTVPPDDAFPQELRMKKMCGIVWCYAGPQDTADRAFKPVRAFKPDLDATSEMPLPALQSMFDEIYPAGDQWYWRADFVGEISDAAIDAHAEHAARLPTWKSSMHLFPINGAASHVGARATPWAYRDANWAQVMTGVDPDPARAPELKQWTVDYFDALHPHSMGGAYVNFMMDEGQRRVQATYGTNYDRLLQLKRTYDPDNVFHINQNIRP